MRMWHPSIEPAEPGNGRRCLRLCAATASFCSPIVDGNLQKARCSNFTSSNTPDHLWSHSNQQLDHFLRVIEYCAFRQPKRVRQVHDRPLVSETLQANAEFEAVEIPVSVAICSSKNAALQPSKVHPRHAHLALEVSFRKRLMPEQVPPTRVLGNRSRHELQCLNGSSAHLQKPSQATQLMLAQLMKQQDTSGIATPNRCCLIAQPREQCDVENHVHDRQICKDQQGRTQCYHGRRFGVNNDRRSRETCTSDTHVDLINVAQLEFRLTDRLFSTSR